MTRRQACLERVLPASDVYVFGRVLQKIELVEGTLKWPAFAGARPRRLHTRGGFSASGIAPLLGGGETVVWKPELCGTDAAGSVGRCHWERGHSGGFCPLHALSLSKLGGKDVGFDVLLMELNFLSPAHAKCI